MSDRGPRTPPEVVGRSRPIAEIRAALAEGPVHVWGPPGIGKTTVLRAVGARWAGPVGSASLADAATADEAMDAVRRLLSLGPEANVPAALRARPGLLLVLDDTDALSADLAGLVQGLADAGAAVVSAGRPRAEGVPGVALPPLGAEHAAQTWLAAARVVVPGGRWELRAVRDLCRRLEGLPLALVVSGRRARTLAPDDPGLLAAITSDGALRTVLDHALDGLPAAQRDALAAAAVFEGAFDSRAFAAVTGAGGEVAEALLDGALLVAEEGSALRLPTVLRERLLQRSPLTDAVRARHAAHVAAAGREGLRAWRTTGDPRAIEALRPDLARLARSGDLDAAVVYANLCVRRGPIVDPFVDTGGRFDAGVIRARILGRQHRHDAALALLDAHPPGDDPTERAAWARERVTVLLAAGRVEEAERWGPELRRVLPSAELAAESALVESTLHLRRGRPGEALAVLRGASAAVEGLTLPDLQGRIGAHLGAALGPSDPEAAVRAMERALVAFAATRDDRWAGIVGGWLGMLHHDRGDLGAAQRSLEDAAAHAARAGAPSFEAHARVALAMVHLEAGASTEAEAALRRAESSGAWSPIVAATARGAWGLLHLRRPDPAGALPHLVAATERFAERSSWSAAATWAAFAAMVDPARRPRLAELGTRAHDAVILAIVDEAAAGAVSEATRRAARGRADLRLLIALADGAAVVVSADGRELRLPDGTVALLANRPTLVRLVAALVAAGPGVPVAREALLAAGWPGQRLVGGSGHARLHVAVSTLRKAGLPLVTADGAEGVSYALRGDVRVARGA